jgi:excisionase family DNA binding protein
MQSCLILVYPKVLSVEKTFCTTREAADLLGVSVGTVQLWVESGLLKAWKTTGGHRRVLRESIDGLLHRAPSAAASPPASAIPDIGDSEKLRILVVEDDPSLQRLYQVNLSKWEMAPEVTVLDNPISALLHIGRTSPDLLITDLHMPGVDGFYMLRALEHAPHVANTAIVVVSGLDAADIAQRGGVPDGVEVLPKPVPFAKLYAKAQSLQDRLSQHSHFSNGGIQ